MITIEGGGGGGCGGWEEWGSLVRKIHHVN